MDTKPEVQKDSLMRIQQRPKFDCGDPNLLRNEWLQGKTTEEVLEPATKNRGLAFLGAKQEPKGGTEHTLKRCTLQAFVRGVICC